MNKTISQVCAVTAMLALLSGCGGFGDKSTGSSDTVGSSSEPLICFGSKTVMSVEDFRKKLKMLQESQPGLENILSSMPEQEQLKVYAQFAEGCVSEQLIREYVKEKGLDKSDEYKALEKQVHEAVDGNLRMNAFQQELGREVTAAANAMSDADLRSYYEQNREKDQMFKREPFIQRGSKDGKYADFDAPGIKEALKQMVQQAKFGELFQAKMEELKNKYGARVDMTCLQQLVVKNQPQQQEASSEQQEEMPAATAQTAQAV